MPSKKDSSPATRAELHATRDDLKGDIKSVRDELKTDIKRLALGLDKTNQRMTEMEQGLRADMRELKTDVTTKLDTFIGRMETLWRESAMLPKAVDDHAEKIRDHEMRLSRLESIKS